MNGIFFFGICYQLTECKYCYFKRPKKNQEQISCCFFFVNNIKKNILDFY